MKKSVVILIAIIYVAAVALVSFFGLQHLVLEETVYVQRIQILNDDVKVDPVDGSIYVVLYLDEKQEAKYQIEYRVHPENATNQGVNFSYDKQTPNVTVDENGLVKFTGPSAITVTLDPKDGTPLGVKPEILIIAKQK